MLIKTLTRLSDKRKWNRSNFIFEYIYLNVVNRLLSAEIKQLIRVEDNHQNEFYKTKQKIKREQ